jgi:hypothetical protein
MPLLDKLYADVLALDSKDKLILIDKLLTSLHPRNIGVETLWAEEAEERRNAYNAKNIPTTEAQNVFNKYEQ